VKEQNFNASVTHPGNTATFSEFHVDDLKTGFISNALLVFHFLWDLGRFSAYGQLASSIAETQVDGYLSCTQGNHHGCHHPVKQRNLNHKQH
jgi:hypothetical protein